MTKSATPTILISTAPFFRQPVRDGLRAIADAGFQAVEVMVTQDPDTQDPGRLATLTRTFGLRVAAVHAPFLIVTRRVWTPDPVEKIRRAARLADGVGAPLVVVHPPYRWQTAYRRWIAEEILPFSEQTGVTVAVENMFPIRVPGMPPARFHDERRDSADATTSMVLDTSHAAVSGVDIRAVFEAGRNRIRHVHLSDNAGKGWDSHLPLGQGGVLPVDEFLSDLASEFSGTVSLELDLRAWMRDDRALHDLLVAQREYCERRLTRGRRRTSRAGKD
ncbi:MAG TPA: sugar phosphate isomerase/epimerase family protein [Actinomycetota bacterium]|nr:sugar phosphate isomerase/epimerase family protein [Actinomycetota bacterium]